MLGRYIDKSRFPALLYQLPGSGESGRSFPNFDASWLAQKCVFEVVLYLAKFFYVVPKERGRALSPLNDVRAGILCTETMLKPLSALGIALEAAWAV